MTPTLREVAQLAGVSIKTVSNVINGYPHIRPATRERVESAIAELGYTPNLTARNLRAGRSGAITLALPDMGLAYFAELAAQVIETAESAGLIVQLEHTGGVRERELELLRSPRRQSSDGLIFSPLGMSQDDAGALNVPYPLVLLGERIFDGPTDHITMRNHDAARAATEHLLESGRRRIAIIGAHEGEVIGSAGLRFAGYRAALEGAGIAVDPALVGYTGLWHRANGAETMRALVETGVDFDAAFCLNDTLALGAMRALEELGRSVPDDVAVIGFDNLDEAQYSIPSLTTVEPGRGWIADTAVKALNARIDGSVSREERSRTLFAPYRIVERESTLAGRST
ncbi:LacI family DNA-binding transcriptional regulator [Demequina aestuarii]|uniref:LacI family DNA-binding transcriptional regulator n=1 Tax=Demequina aestuarii TaxID=327095 RepID=UPI000785EEAB|nr:LacI family DNA-binding transcriptional regulator [Demequina aestuarii]